MKSLASNSIMSYHVALKLYTRHTVKCSFYSYLLVLVVTTLYDSLVCSAPSYSYNQNGSFGLFEIGFFHRELWPQNWSRLQHIWVFFLRLNNIALYAWPAIFHIFISISRHRSACFHVWAFAVKAAMNTDIQICLWDRLGGSYWIIHQFSFQFLKKLLYQHFVIFVCVYICVIHKSEPQTQYVSIKQGLCEGIVIKIFWCTYKPCMYLLEEKSALCLNVF